MNDGLRAIASYTHIVSVLAEHLHNGGAVEQEVDGESNCSFILTREDGVRIRLIHSHEVLGQEPIND